MIGGKAGIVNIHMGDASDPFRPLYQVVEQSELKFTQFLPTHCNRNPWIFEDAKTWGLKGYVDLTTSSYPYYPDEEIKPSTALRLLLESGVPIGHITFTSDACGSLPGFDPVTGKLVKIEMGLPDSVLREIREAILDERIPPETAFCVATANPATILKLPGKGFIREGYDADILLLDAGWQVAGLMSNGVMVK
ncbi:MAG TPA: amidohydrolase family protein, partial [Prolixibacteraceae bacterium]|nr:amidohydrolase family protein [Prolixibacteraceae bacterium]